MGEEHAELAKAFRLFDKDLDGVLNPHELQVGLERYGEIMKLEDLQLLVSMADRDHDGSINFQEFSRIMTLK
jgi:Ca2+-binding EF-hand superfamily protein